MGEMLMGFSSRHRRYPQTMSCKSVSSFKNNVTWGKSWGADLIQSKFEPF